MRAGLLFFLMLAAHPAAVNADPFPVDSDDEEIRIKVESRADSAGCAFGEINSFSEESKQGPKSFRLLLSFEAIVPQDTPRRRTDISKFDLKKEFSGIYTFPRPRKRVFIGAYLCSDWTVADSCAGKAFAPLEKYFAGNDPRVKKVILPGESRSDEIFHFALLALGAEGGEIVTGRPVPSDMRREMKSAGATDAVLKAVDEALEAFQTPVLRPSPEGLALLFHYRDRSSCE